MIDWSVVARREEEVIDDILRARAYVRPPHSGMVCMSH